MKYYCLEDFKAKNEDFKAKYGEILCTKGKIYDIVDAPEDPDSGYCDILTCDFGGTCNTNWLEVSKHFACIAQFVVVEISEREIVSVKPCDTEKDAIDTANRLLAKHCERIGCQAEFAEDDGKGDEWDRSTRERPYAWCNLQDIFWDAHIVNMSMWGTTAFPYRKGQ